MVEKSVGDGENRASPKQRVLNRVLYIEASPMGEKSHSTQVAQAFLSSYREINPQDQIEHLSLFDVELPEFDREATEAKFAQINGLFSGEGKPEATGKWQQVLAYIEQLRSVDKVVLSAPMWNFSIPYKLKHYIDLICQPGESFTLDKQTFDYIGLIKDKPLQLILSSSSSYADEFPQPNAGVKQDFQHSYLQHAFQFIGFTNIATIKVSPTIGLPQDVEKLMSNKVAEAQAAAREF